MGMYAVNLEKQTNKPPQDLQYWRQMSSSLPGVQKIT